MIAIGAALPWLPFIVWLGQPDRNLLGPMGRTGVIVTVVLQCLSVVVGLVFVVVMSAWTETRGWQAARIWGSIAFVWGIPLAWLAAVVWPDGVWPRESGLPLIVFGVICVILIVPALINPRRTGLVAVIGTILPLVILFADHRFDNLRPCGLHPARPGDGVLRRCVPQCFRGRLRQNLTLRALLLP
ncbi:hypothetical protein [Cryobacterium sp. 10C3]|uniref:hypothetical protein n=1 Tax=Cryobacterium sp. 10C3 TaxID=3048577 RepID=UPI002AB43AE2|nr:hypothetical protein [Cryobacterium sp. 10C3]MDY7557656.1 hypothetical protein [Cryobacterium sp. 10C3]